MNESGMMDESGVTEGAGRAPVDPTPVTDKNIRPVRLLGYSERGMVNAICDDIYRAENPTGALEGFLSLCRFPYPPDRKAPSFTKIAKATLLVEQSFSDFGDLDLLILIDHEDNTRQAILLEAKVNTDTTSPVTIRRRWQDFLEYLSGNKDTKEKKTSGLFVQLYRKLRLVRQTHDLDELLESDSVAGLWRLGANKIVLMGAGLLAEYVKNPWYIALVPDSGPDLERFFDSELRVFSPASYNLPDWSVERWGYITWADVEGHCKGDGQSWKRTIDNFEWNRGQIYRTGTVLDGGMGSPVAFGQIRSLGTRMVLVVWCRNMDTNCRVVPLAEVGDYFPKSEKVEKALLGQVVELSLDLDTRPLRPAKRAIHSWDPPTGEDPQPLGRPQIPQAPKLVKIEEPGWEKSAVRVVEYTGKTSGQKFWVFNHHIKKL